MFLDESPFQCGPIVFQFHGWLLRVNPGAHIRFQHNSHKFRALAATLKKTYEFLQMHLMTKKYQMHPVKMANFTLTQGVQSVVCRKGNGAIRQRKCHACFQP